MSEMDFFAEPEADSPDSLSPWRVLVVDDEPDIQQVTALVAAGFLHNGRKIELVSAESGEAARRILEASDDFALALIDVVMETRTAGLDLVDHIRKTLDNNIMRIILRTGQPGDAPEDVVVRNYDISEYREKSQLGADQLRSVLRTNLTTYEAMRQLEGTRLHLEEINQELSSFSHVVAHDLQGPLGLVSGFAGLLASKYAPQLDDDAQVMVEEIVNSAKSMTRLINDLLALSRVGREQKSLEPVDLNEVAANVLENLAQRIREKSAIVELGVLPTLSGVRVYLLQLLQNLIDNAIKYNDSAQPRVELQAEDQGPNCVLRFRDNGIGIPETEIGKILKPFGRGAGASLARGSGIGLTTCQRIIEFHGGSLEIHPNPTGGSEFVITLPTRLHDGHN